MVDERKFKLSEIADALDVSLTRLRTMRARGQTAMWDAGIEESEDDAAHGWRHYSVLDGVAAACVIDLIGKGVAAQVAADAVANCRDKIFEGPHPRAPHRSDVWIGVLSFNDGQAHVGGQLPDLLLDIDQRVRADVRQHDNGGGSGLILVNASNHFRTVSGRLIDE